MNINQNDPFEPQTFFVSRQPSMSPLTAEMKQFGKKLVQLKLHKDNKIIISTDYGNRVLITKDNINADEIQQDDITEIVDYDPIKKITMAIGKKDPNINTPVHWIIHRARTDVHAVVQIINTDLIEKYQKKLPITKEKPPATLESAKEILKNIRENKTILIPNQGLLFVGFNLKEIEQNLDTLLKGE